MSSKRQSRSTTTKQDNQSTTTTRSSSHVLYPTTQQSQHLPPGSVRLASRSPYVNTNLQDQLISTPSTSNPNLTTGRSVAEYSMPGTYNDVFYNNNTNHKNNQKTQSSSGNVTTTAISHQPKRSTSVSSRSSTSSSTSQRISRKDMNQNSSTTNKSIQSNDIPHNSSQLSQKSTNGHNTATIVSNKNGSQTTLPPPGNNHRISNVSTRELISSEEHGRLSNTSTTNKTNTTTTSSSSKPKQHQQQQQQSSTKSISQQQSIKSIPQDDDLLLLSSTNMMHYTKHTTSSSSSATKSNSSGMYINQHTPITEGNERDRDFHTDDDSSEYSDFDDNDDDEIHNNNTSFQQQQQQQQQQYIPDSNRTIELQRDLPSHSFHHHNNNNNIHPNNNNNNYLTTTVDNQYPQITQQQIQSNGKKMDSLTNHKPRPQSQIVLDTTIKTTNLHSTSSTSRTLSSTSLSSSSSSSLSTTNEEQIQINTQQLNSLPIIEAPFCRETYQQLIDINTVPREVYLDYLQEIRKQPNINKQSQTTLSTIGHDSTISTPSTINNSQQLLQVPKEVEHWSVKLPTRLEFKNITIRVMKKFPINNNVLNESQPTHPKVSQLPPGSNINPQLHPHSIHDTNQQLTTKLKSKSQHHQNQQHYQHKSPSSIHAGYEYDLESSQNDKIDGFLPHFPEPTLSSNNNNSQHDINTNNDDDESSDDELFSPSSFRRKQDELQTRQQQKQYHESSNSPSIHSLPQQQQQRQLHQNTSKFSATSIHSTTLGYNIPKPNQLFDDSDDDEAFESSTTKTCCFSSKQKFESKPVTILDNLNGCIEPGQMVAIMGGSGAGKTTLLNALSGRIPLIDPTTPIGQTQLQDTTCPINAGSICFNSTRVTESELASMTGYVLQNDVFLGTLTPRETLQFAAKLQLPPAISETRRLKRVERVIQQLDLTHIADSQIGGMFSKGISGGQKRRVSVGIELIKDPSVIFLDEPTSGLDSTTAVNVMRVLKHLAQTGRTVIFTIHSPNSKILELFDTMILLSRGRIAYFGPAKKTLPYFSSLGYDCPLYSNPAEFFLNVLTPNTIAMFHTMLHTTHHSPEDMLTPMDPRWKSIVLLRAQQGYHGYQSSTPIPLFSIHKSSSTSLSSTSTSLSNNSSHTNNNNNNTNQYDWIQQFLGYGDSTMVQDDTWSVYINGIKQETLRQRRRRHLVEQQHKQYDLLSEYRTINETDINHITQYRQNPLLNGSKIWNYSLFPQSTHIYQQLFYSSSSSLPPPPNPSYLSAVQYQALNQHQQSQQLYHIDEILLERENKRLTLITDTYLKYPIQPNHQLSPFLTNYVPKLRLLDKEGVVALQEIGFDFQIKNNNRQVNNLNSSTDLRTRKVDIVQPGKAPLPYFDQLKVLTHRTFLHTIRDPLNTFARIIVNLLLSFFVGLLFFQTGQQQSSLYARVGFLFFMTSIQAFITVMGAVLTFAEERALFIREYQKQIYSTSAYFLGRTMIDVIMQTILSILFGSIAYPMVGLKADFWKFVQYTICLIMVAQGTHSYALVLGALVPYRTVALMLSPVVMVPFLTVSGFLCPLDQLSPAISWLTYLSPQRWMFEAMMNLELNGLQFHCQPSEYITVPLDDGTISKICPVLTGDFIIHLFFGRVQPRVFTINLIACAIIAVVIKVIALFALKLSAKLAIRSTGA